MKVILEPYDQNWPLMFEQERKALTSAIAEEGVSVEHMGSTSIEGLSAKPIVDIIVGLQDFNTANRHIASMEKLGYVYVDKFEDIMPFRRYFTKSHNGNKTHHVHMVQFGSEFWNRHLRFRDHLRNNPEDRNAYESLKKSLAQKDWKSGSEYANAKSDFIQGIDQKIT